MYRLSEYEPTSPFIGNKHVTSFLVLKPYNEVPTECKQN